LFPRSVVNTQRTHVKILGRDAAACAENPYTSNKGTNMQLYINYSAQLFQRLHILVAQVPGQNRTMYRICRNSEYMIYATKS